MNVTLSSGNGRWGIVASAIKTYTVAGPLLLVLLVRGIRLDGRTALGLVEVGYVLAFLGLLVLGLQKLSSKQPGIARSNFVFAGVALFWLATFAFLLPPLAST